MFKININELSQYADPITLQKGEELFKQQFFNLKDIRAIEYPYRYDSVVYSITWNPDNKWSSYIRTTQIEVNIEDKIVGFNSYCECDTKQMCEHTVCLAFSINQKLENQRLQMGEEAYASYEDHLVKKYEEGHTQYLNKLHQQQAKESKRALFSLISSYDALNKKVALKEKVHLDLMFKNDHHMMLAFKIGIHKKYVLKNMYEFIYAVLNKSNVFYGKELEFYHDLNNFDDISQKVISLLIQGTNYWMDGIYYHDASNRQRYIAISRALFEEILKIYVNNTITYVYDNNPQEYYLSDKTYNGKLYFDGEKIILKDLKHYSLYLGVKYHYLFLENTIYPFAGITEATLPLYNYLISHHEINIKEQEKVFLQEIYPLIYDQIEIDNAYKEAHPITEVKIDSYFDFDHDILTITSKYYIGDKETNLETLKSGTYSYSRLNQYTSYLEGLGFVDGQIEDMEKITAFMKTDLSPLKKSGEVYLSESIKETTIKTMKKVVVNLSYNVDLFSVCFEDLGFSNDELYQIISEFKKKKKYVRLNKDIIELDEPKMQQLLDIIDDFDLDLKNLNEIQERPLYKAMKAFNQPYNDVIIHYNDHLKKMIAKLKNFKNNHYEIPSTLQTVLRNYQVEGFKWLKTLVEYHFGGILADDMGLGKTLEIISLIVSDVKDMASLIICPTSLIYNWQNEITKWAPNLPFTIINGPISQRKAIIDAIDGHKQIYITSYDTFKNDVELYDCKTFRFVILDEAQFIKNYYTQKAQAVKAINSEIRFVLTGTPIENSLLDLWSIFDFLLPGYLSNHNNFKSKYEKAIVSHNNQELLSQLIKKITPFILRRTKKSVLKDLPNKFETISYAQMDPDQRKIYEAYLLSTKQMLEAGKTKFEILSNLTRLRQLCVHPNMFLDNYQGSSAKVILCMDIIKQSLENDHKILVFSQFTSLFSTLEKALKDNNITYYVLTGSTKAIDRINMVNNFNENEAVKVFLISLKAGGTGLNLTGADIVIHFDPWWNVSVENQASDRAHRIGQKRSVQVIKLICENTIEQKVIELQTIKKELADKIISDDEGNIQKLDDKDLLYLLS